MGFNIESGDHNSFSAIVDKDGRLLTAAKTTRSLTVAADAGDGFYAVTDGFIALTTTASFSGVLYMKNTNTNKDIRIAQLRTCGTVAQEWIMYKNPTAGTLISAGTAKVPQNINFKSGNVFDGSVLVGVDAQTVTDGDILAQWINGIGHSTHDFDGSVKLGTNDTLALAVKPGVAGDVCISILVFFD